MTRPAYSESYVLGIGMTELSRRSGRTVMELALEAAHAAAADAGMSPRDIDGVVTYGKHDSIRASDLASALGCCEVNWVSDLDMGGQGSVVTVGLAAELCGGGRAKNILVLRAMNARSGKRLGRGLGVAADEVQKGPSIPDELLSPAHLYSLWANRYLHEHGGSVSDFADVVMLIRGNGARNDRALLRDKPLTREDYFASRVLADPLRIADCCLETDGAAALIVGPKGSNGSAHPPVRVAGFGVAGARPSPFPGLSQDPFFEVIPPAAVNRALGDAGTRVTDMDVVMLYDCFSVCALLQIENLGLAPPGRAAAFVREHLDDAERSLRINPSGGMMAEGYVHGLNNTIEAVRQLRQESGAVQVADARRAIVSGFGGPFGAALVLER